MQMSSSTVVTDEGPGHADDPGAIQALPIVEVSNRLQSGLVEVLFKQALNDRTNWRAMLKGDVAELDLEAERDALLEQMSERHLESARSLATAVEKAAAQSASEDTVRDRYGATKLFGSGPPPAKSAPSPAPVFAPTAAAAPPPAIDIALPGAAGSETSPSPSSLLRLRCSIRENNRPISNRNQIGSASRVCS